MGEHQRAPTKALVLRNIAKVFSGTAAGQLILVASLPLLGRLLGEADFAKYAMVLAITNVLGALLCLRLENVILLVDPSQRHKVHSACFATSLVLALVLSSLWYSISNYSFGFVAACGLSAFFFSMFNSISVRLNAEKLYGLLALTRFLRPTLEVAFALILISGEYEYYLALPLSYFLSITIVYCFSGYSKKICSIENPIVYLRKNIDFVRYDVPATASYVFATYAPFMIIGYFYGDEKLALFSLAFRAAIGPINILVQSISVISRKDFVDATDESQLLYKFKFWQKALVGLSFILVLGIVMMFMVSGFQMILGPKWNGVDMVVLLLTPFISAKLVGVPLSYIFIVKKELLTNMIIQIFGVIIIVVSLAGVAIMDLSFETGVLTYSLVYSLFYAYYIHAAYERLSL